MEVTENLLKLRAIFEETLAAEEARNVRRLAELNFEEEAIRIALTPTELRTHMLYLIEVASGVAPQAVLDEVTRRCGSDEPEKQNVHLERILCGISDTIEQEHSGSGYGTLLPQGPKGMQ